jgi:hypothetical protein
MFLKKSFIICLSIFCNCYLTEAGWYTETVESDGYIGTDTSLALDNSGNPHISYRDVSNSGPKYAYYDGSCILTALG